MREIDWTALRDDLTARKTAAIDDLPALVERFTEEAEAVGAKVYRAADAAEANRIVAAICRAKKAKLVVKSKSMATEEIGLTEHLEKQGVRAIETDLGEWIIQLAHERPSHLIAPAIHKTREEVAQLFAKVVGHPVPDDTASLVAVARAELRQYFLNADIGLKTQIGVHGPKELHFVLLDNGRSAMREDPAFRDALRCIRCGACSNVCPSYQVVGGHVFGHVYTGAIGLVVSPWHHGTDSVAYEQGMCLGCNACDTVCPVSIPLASLITEVRAKAVERIGLSLPKRVLLKQWSAPEAIDRVAGWLAILQGPFRHDGLVRVPFGAIAKEKSLPAISDRPLHFRAREVTQTNPSSPATRVALFPSCLVA